ncbi:MAG: hypothetical protein JWL73_528 [Actinomycetia bacterium]|nr:hypothetical protein [Actinomycetes bacterium]
MPFDENEYAKGLRRWATTELPAFRVEAWPESPAVDVTGALGGTSESGTRTDIVMSKTSSHRRDDGAWIDVVSHRPDDPAGLKEWAPRNMLIRAAKREVGPNASARKHNTTVNQLHRAADNGEIPWDRARVSVDGLEVDFDVMEVGDGWAAFAELDDVVITIDAHQVERGGLRLVTVNA